MAESDLKEPAFGQNDFRKPRVLEGPEVVVQSVLMVLFGKPGCFPSIPELGMNIRQYRIFDTSTVDTEAIADTLAMQCGLIRDGLIKDTPEVSISTTNTGEPVLLIQIPVSNETENYNLVVGIAERDNEAIYNYELVNQMLMQ